MTKADRQAALASLGAEISWDNWQDEETGKFFRISGVLFSRLEWFREVGLKIRDARLVDAIQLWIEAYDGLLKEGPDTMKAQKQSKAERMRKINAVAKAIDDETVWGVPAILEVRVAESLQEIINGMITDYGLSDDDTSDDDTGEHFETLDVAYRYIAIHEGMLKG